MQPIPRGNVVVPLDQNRASPRALDRVVEEAPYGICHLAAVRIDEQPGAAIVEILGMAAKVDFLDLVQREFVNVVGRLKSVVGGGDEHIVDVEKEPTAGAFRDRPDERNLAHLGGFKDNVGRRILKQDFSFQHRLNLVDMLAHPLQSPPCIGHGQEVVEIGSLVGGPGKML